MQRSRCRRHWLNWFLGVAAKNVSGNVLVHFNVPAPARLTPRSLLFSNCLTMVKSTVSGYSLGLMFWCLTLATHAQTAKYDVVIYGATSAGVTASIQAAKMGKSVVLVGPDQHVGGLSSGGLGQTDSGDKRVIGGVSRQFYQRVKQHYDQSTAWTRQSAAQFKGYQSEADAMWGFEPHVAESIFKQLLSESGVEVKLDEWLDRAEGVRREDGRITSIRMLSGQAYQGRIFMDATYEGDLLAAAGISYTVGREGNQTYAETFNGVHTSLEGEGLGHHQFVTGVDPYVIPGDPASGLLPFVGADGPGQEGSADKRLQAYNFRMCLTDDPANQIPFVKPAEYNELWYELLFRNFEAAAGGAQGPKPAYTMSSGAVRIPWINSPMPNRKTDTNNQGAVSTDFIGQNYDYPEASYAERAEMIARHKLWQQGLMWTLANHPRVPDAMRNEVARWGLAADEFVDNGNWPHQIYVRESRRMVGDFVLNENHLRGRLPVPQSVGMGSYNIDSHHVQRYVTADGQVRNEGDIEVPPGAPYPIDYRALVPKRGECTNLLVPVCISCSHIAYGSVRMEPVFMILGQSAGTAAALAIDHAVPVQDVEYSRLQARLLADQQILER